MCPQSCWLSQIVILVPALRCSIPYPAYIETPCGYPLTNKIYASSHSHGINPPFPMIHRLSRLSTSDLQLFSAQNRTCMPLKPGEISSSAGYTPHCVPSVMLAKSNRHPLPCIALLNSVSGYIETPCGYPLTKIYTHRHTVRASIYHSL